jgi:hypothetical protein
MAARAEPEGEAQRRLVQQKRKTHGELCRTILNDVANGFAASFPAYESLGRVLKEHAGNDALRLAKSTAGVLHEVSDALDELATMQAVRAGEIRNIARDMQRFDGETEHVHSVCSTVSKFIAEEYQPIARRYAAAKKSYDTEHDQEATRKDLVDTRVADGQDARSLSAVHRSKSKLTQLKVEVELETQQYNAAKQQLAEQMRWFDHQHAAILRRGIGDLVCSEMGLHCRAMQLHAALFQTTDEIWPDTSQLTGWVDRGRWKEGRCHSFLKAESPELSYESSIPRFAPSLDVPYYWRRAGGTAAAAAGLDGAPKGSSLVEPHVSWVHQLELAPPDLGWYLNKRADGGEEVKEIRQVVNVRGAFDAKSREMAHEYKVCYVDASEPDIWTRDTKSGELALRLLLQDKVCAAWMERRESLLELIERARDGGQAAQSGPGPGPGPGQGTLESLRRELTIHDSDSWQSVVGWAAQKGESVSSLPAQEIVDRYSRDREARGKNRNVPR